MDVDKLREAREKLSEAMEYAAGRWSEWGDRAEHVAELLGAVLASLDAESKDDPAIKVGRHFCAAMPCTPADCGEVPCRYLSDAIARRNNRTAESAPAPQRSALDFALEIESKLGTSSWRTTDLANYLEMWYESRIHTEALEAEKHPIPAPREEGAARAIVEYFSGQGNCNAEDLAVIEHHLAALLAAEHREEGRL